MSETRQQRNRRIKTIFAGAALVFVLTGLVLYLFAGRLGIDKETAEFLAFAFLTAGVVDYFVLRFWDRLMGNKTDDRT